MERQVANYSIALRQEASEPEHFAADELRRYLAEIGGATFAASHSNGPALHIGVRTRSVNAALEDRKEDSFVILTEGEDLYLTGNTPLGTLYAVYRFLEEYLGCGWLQPGDDEVPKRETVTIPARIRRVEEPRFSHRSVNLYPYFPERALPRIDWAAKNRLNWIHVCTNSSNHWEAFDSRKTFVPELRKRGLHLNFGGHTFNTWVPPKTYLESHPEYFSLIGGKRDPSQLNIANPEVVRVAAEAMNAFLDDNPEVEMIDMWLNDTTRFDESEEVQRMEGVERLSLFGKVTGRELQSRTNANIRFVNAIARKVAAKHPQVFVQTLAYFQLIDAPMVKPEPNVFVGYAPISRVPALLEETATGYWYPLTQPDHVVNSLHLEEIQEWLDVVSPDRFFVYEYYSHITTALGMVDMNTSPDDLERLIDPSSKVFHVYTDAIAKDIQLYAEIGVTGIGSEDWDWNELNMYLYARLLWNPNSSSNAVIADYCRRSFGEAAMPMFRHWLVLQDSRESFRSQKDLALSFIEQAKERRLSAAQRRRIEAVAAIWRHID